MGFSGNRLALGARRGHSMKCNLSYFLVNGSSKDQMITWCKKATLAMLSTSWIVGRYSPFY